MNDSVLDAEAEELADDIVGISTYEASSPQPRQFFPWHKPRKQFVRNHQFCKQIESLIKDHGRKELKYLGLPGNDLLDLRYLHDRVCQPQKLPLTFLGFDTSAQPESPAQTDLNISLDEVRKLDFINPISDVMGDDFCGMANLESIAFRNACNLGPYDVINLDLCGGVAVHSPAIDNSYYSALDNLLTLQAKQTNPWLLFLTTRVGEEDINAEVLKILADKFQSNLDSSPEFQAVSQEKLAIGCATTLAEALKTGDGLVRVFITAICKWLAGRVICQNPPTTLEVKSIIGYRVYEGVDYADMQSIAIKFSPILATTPDPMGLAKQSTNPLDEGALATKVAGRVSSRKNADDILSASGDLMEEMKNETKALLALARYDMNAYDGWLETA